MRLAQTCLSATILTITIVIGVASLPIEKNETALSKSIMAKLVYEVTYYPLPFTGEEPEPKIVKPLSTITKHNYYTKADEKEEKCDFNLDEDILKWSKVLDHRELDDDKDKREFNNKSINSDNISTASAKISDEDNAFSKQNIYSKDDEAPSFYNSSIEEPRRDFRGRPKPTKTAEMDDNWNRIRPPNGKNPGKY